MNCWITSGKSREKPGRAEIKLVPKVTFGGIGVCGEETADVAVLLSKYPRVRQSIPYRTNFTAQYRPDDLKPLVDLRLK